MTIFQVKRQTLDGWRIVDRIKESKRLSNGPHTIEHEGVKIPVRIKGDKVTVDIEGARGNLSKLSSPDVPTDTLGWAQRRLVDFTVDTELGGGHPLAIIGKPDSNEGVQHDVTLERHSPSWGRRK